MLFLRQDRWYGILRRKGSFKHPNITFYVIFFCDLLTGHLVVVPSQWRERQKMRVYERHTS